MSTASEERTVVTTGSGADDGDDSLLKRVLGLQSFWILGVLIVICLVFSVVAGERSFRPATSR